MEKKQRVLIVDDVPSNIKILDEILRPEYQISAATSGKKALDIAFSDYPPDLVLLDVMMPEMDGYQVCEKLKAEPRTHRIPVLFVTAMGDVEDETRGLAVGAVDYITKPISPAIVRARVKNHMNLKLYQDHLEDLVAARTLEITRTQEATIQSLASLAETRDNETGGHIMRTQRYVKIMALELKAKGVYKEQLTAENIELMYKSAPLHDIGKVGVRDAILLKPGRLTEEEFEEMKKHTTYGRDAILKAEHSLAGQPGSSFLRIAREIAYTHHERWDGSGYPQKLKQRDIPLSGRIMAVADVYDALVTRRVYKPPFPHGKAVEIMAAGRGGQFDPDVMDAFLGIEERFRRIGLKFADSDEERKALGEN